MAGGNWLSGSTINLADVTEEGTEFLLDEAVSKGTNDDVVRVDLPDKMQLITQPFSGTMAYDSQSGDNLSHAMYTPWVDLTGASESVLTFKTWYDIEADYDYGYIQVFDGAAWHSVEGNITTNANPAGENLGNGITGNSEGWIDAEFDLSAFAGQNIIVEFSYITDGGVANTGMFVDDIHISADGGTAFADNADGLSEMDQYGFNQTDGTRGSSHYYLIEWRSHNGVDAGLGHVNVAGELLSFNQGMLVWYVDGEYSDNWVGNHPGNGFLGVVDADQHENYWSDHEVASTRYQVRDAAFSLDKDNNVMLDLSDLFGIKLKDNFTARNPLFDDSKNYLNSAQPDAGRAIPNLGLKVRVVSQSQDKSVGKILISK